MSKKNYVAFVAIQGVNEDAVGAGSVMFEAVLRGALEALQERGFMETYGLKLREVEGVEDVTAAFQQIAKGPKS